MSIWWISYLLNENLSRFSIWAATKLCPSDDVSCSIKGILPFTQIDTSSDLSPIKRNVIKSLKHPMSYAFHLSESLSILYLALVWGNIYLNYDIRLSIDPLSERSSVIGQSEATTICIFFGYSIMLSKFLLVCACSGLVYLKVLLSILNMSFQVALDRLLELLGSVFFLYKDLYGLLPKRSWGIFE